MSGLIPPGSTIGVLGSGQLGRMFAMEAANLGYRVHTFSPDTDTPMGQVCEREWVAGYHDVHALLRFGETVDVATFEFENVPAEAAETVQERAPIFPGPDVLRVVQNRLREKKLFHEHGFPTPAFQRVANPDDYESALRATGVPAVLKTATAGYDGKGQAVVHSLEELAAAWEKLGGVECILEAFVDFVAEASIIVARGRDGQCVSYPLFRNDHRNHILDVTSCPGGFPPEVEREATRIGEGIAFALDLTGLLCVELFITADQRVLVNELAPRPHNSGHLTLDCFPVSQFEQLLRAITGLPLGSADGSRPGAMVNLLGDLWESGEPDWSHVLSDPGAHLHLYGKQSARPGRKMGHITVHGDSPDAAANRAQQIRGLLAGVPIGQ